MAPAQLKVRNWEQFQHYKDRNPPWIKLHFALLASEDWVTLDDASKLLAVVCMLVASRNNGFVPDNPAYLKRVAYLDRLPKLKPLIDCGFLEIPQADASAVQALRKRMLDQRQRQIQIRKILCPKRVRTALPSRRRKPPIRTPSKRSGRHTLEHRTCRSSKRFRHGKNSTRTIAFWHRRLLSRSRHSSERSLIWKSSTPAGSSASAASKASPRIIGRFRTSGGKSGWPMAGVKPSGRPRIGDRSPAIPEASSHLTSCNKATAKAGANRS